MASTRAIPTTSPHRRRGTIAVTVDDQGSRVRVTVADDGGTKMWLLLPAMR